MIPEKFSTQEVSALRTELLHAGLDSWQAAELFQLFLAGRGYGVSPEMAKDAANRIGGSGCALDIMQLELERLAVMN